ncbi:Hypothetical predicted protein, partial [Olea europaea subsp. europaea]
LKHLFDSTDNSGFVAGNDDCELFEEDTLSGFSDDVTVSNYDDYLEFYDGSSSSYDEDEDE